MSMKFKRTWEWIYLNISQHSDMILWTVWTGCLPEFLRERPGLFSYELTLGQEEETFQAQRGNERQRWWFLRWNRVKRCEEMCHVDSCGRSLWTACSRRLVAQNSDSYGIHWDNIYSYGVLEIWPGASPTGSQVHKPMQSSGRAKGCEQSRIGLDGEGKAEAPGEIPKKSWTSKYASGVARLLHRKSMAIQWKYHEIIWNILKFKYTIILFTSDSQVYIRYFRYIMHFKRAGPFGIHVRAVQDSLWSGSFHPSWWGQMHVSDFLAAQAIVSHCFHLKNSSES